MKKLSIYVLTIMFSFTLMGCSVNNNLQNNSGTNTSKDSTNNLNMDESNTTDKSTAGEGGYKDGVYMSQVKSLQAGFEEAVVTIKDGKIQNVELKRLDKKKKEVEYEQWDGTKWGHPNLKQYRLDLAKAMINKQSYDVDSISGATDSSKGWKAAASEALSKAR